MKKKTNLILQTNAYQFPKDVGRLAVAVRILARDAFLIDAVGWPRCTRQWMISIGFKISTFP